MQKADAVAVPTPPKNRTRVPLTLAEVFWAFLRAGCLSFGGPVAHLSLFHTEFVSRRKWLDDTRFAELLALCQFLPGPASSQLVFALGMHRAGFWGAVLASVGFTAPSAFLMLGFAYQVTLFPRLLQTGALHGLKLAAVAVVAQAVWAMGRRLCPDRVRTTLALVSAAFLLWFPSAMAQVAVIFGGGVLTLFVYRQAEPAEQPVTTPPSRPAQALSAVARVVFALLLLFLPVLAATTGEKKIAMFDAFYRAGSLVFGGGHVVLPLLRSVLVPNGWLTDDQFLGGYGAAQALPGPLFTFSAYLGAVMAQGLRPWLWGCFCLFAIFLPAWLLVGGVLPFWQLVAKKTWVRASLLGANAAVVGVLLSALYHPVFSSAVHGAKDVAAVLVAFGALQVWKAPPWLVVVAFAVVGWWLV